MKRIINPFTRVLVLPTNVKPVSAIQAPKRLTFEELVKAHYIAVLATPPDLASEN